MSEFILRSFDSRLWYLGKTKLLKSPVMECYFSFIDILNQLLVLVFMKILV